MADNETETNVQNRGLDGAGFGLDIFEALAEGGIIGTLAAEGITALSTLSVSLIPSAQATAVGVVIAAVIVARQVRRAYQRNRQN